MSKFKIKGATSKQDSDINILKHSYRSTIIILLSNITGAHRDQ